MNYVEIETFVRVAEKMQSSRKVFLSKNHVSQISESGYAGYSAVDYGWGHFSGTYIVKGSPSEIAELFS